MWLPYNRSTKSLEVVERSLAEAEAAVATEDLTKQHKGWGLLANMERITGQFTPHSRISTNHPDVPPPVPFHPTEASEYRVLPLPSGGGGGVSGARGTREALAVNLADDARHPEAKNCE